MDIQASLEALCSCPGPSGREDAVASQAMELLRPLMDEVKKDRFGNVIGIRHGKRQTGGAGRPLG